MIGICKREYVFPNSDSSMGKMVIIFPKDKEVYQLISIFIPLHYISIVGKNGFLRSETGIEPIFQNTWEFPYISLYIPQKLDDHLN